MLVLVLVAAASFSDSFSVVD